MSDKSGTNLLSRRSVASKAADAIRDMVISGELRAGEMLPSERQLALELQISRPTLRQAIGSLTAGNILESRHGGGTFVTSLTPAVLTEPIKFLLQIDESAVLSLFEVRCILEVNAAELAATRASDEQVAQLEDVLKEAAAKVTDREAFINLDFQLHEGIVQAVGNPLLSSLCDSISRLSMESRRLTGGSLTVRRRAHRDHQAIVAAMRAGDPQATAKAMKDHLAAIEQEYRRLDRAGKPASPPE